MKTANNKNKHHPKHYRIGSCIVSVFAAIKRGTTQYRVRWFHLRGHQTQTFICPERAEAFAIAKATELHGAGWPGRTSGVSDSRPPSSQQPASPNAK